MLLYIQRMPVQALCQEARTNRRKNIDPLDHIACRRCAPEGVRDPAAFNRVICTFEMFCGPAAESVTTSTLEALIWDKSEFCKVYRTRMLEVLFYVLGCRYRVFPVLCNWKLTVAWFGFVASIVLMEWTDFSLWRRFVLRRPLRQSDAFAVLYGKIRQFFQVCRLWGVLMGSFADVAFFSFFSSASFFFGNQQLTMRTLMDKLQCSLHFGSHRSGRQTGQKFRACLEKKIKPSPRSSLVSQPLRQSALE